MIETKNLSLINKIVQSPGLIVSDMDGEKVMLSINKGKYYNLGEIGGDIWNIIEKPTTIKEVITKLVSDYNVEKENCEEDVMMFLGSLIKENIIKIIENEEIAHS